MRWREIIHLAPNVEAVKAVMRDYVGDLGPVVDALPADCREALQGDFDVQAAAVALLRAEMCFEGSEETRGLLHELAYTFASAAVRITLLHARPAPLA